MKATELCPPKHLEAADIGDDVGNELVVTIKTVGITTVGTQEKPEQKGAIYFEEFGRGMVVNRTNVKRLITLLGGDTDQWAGKRITLYRSEADYQGEVRPCIRVREKLPK